MMRFVLAFLTGFLVFSLSHAQILEPAKWTFELSKKEVKAGEEVDLILKATIDDNWYMYANGFDPNCGPLITEVIFGDTKNFQVVGSTVAINSTDKYDEIFGCDVKIFKKKAELRQKIKILGSPVTIAGAVQGQVCTEVDGKCIPFDAEFTFSDIVVTGGSTQRTETKKQPEKTAVITAPQLNKDTTASTTQRDTLASIAEDETKSSNQNRGPRLDPTVLEGEAEGSDYSLFGYVIFAFILGLTSLVTPCVFPMIPMTITFFLKDKQSKKEGVRKAIIFGISIILIYTVVGTLFALLLGPDGLNAMATHWLPNLFISLIFIVFALSFLGLFEINAPHQLVNTTDRAAERGGLIGIFFMAATLVLVSFSCTLPLVGNVLVMAAGGEFIKPVFGMLAYSFAYALPFALFAMFPEWLKGLPKSGGWLNAVKVTLGLFELALAFKFFSIADLSYQWGLLDRDINIAIWIVIFTILGFYLLGKIRFPNDSPVEKVGIPRLMFAIVVFSFVVYLIPGLWGAPLKALAGYLPPMYTHDFNLIEKLEQRQEIESIAGHNVCVESPKYSEFLHLPHGLKGYFDYDETLACARKLNKPLFIDFTGHGCTNCREMEANVWAHPEVLRRLKEDYVVVALYVDDRTLLPESEWYTSTYDNKVKKTIGKQNADLQITSLENNAQPFYVLVGKDERVLAWPKAYDKSVENFIDFLDNGKKTYNRLYANQSSNM